jgi:hypothetical protein
MLSEPNRNPPRAIKRGDFVLKFENDRPRFVDRLEYNARRKMQVAIVVEGVNDIWESIPLNELILVR